MLCIDGGSGGAGERARKGRGEGISESLRFGGDCGECTVTFGGDLVDERGGPNDIIDDGLGLGVLQGANRPVRPRGVMEPPLLASRNWDAVGRPPFSRGMSSDIRPSALLWSSGMPRRSGVLGDVRRGVAGACVLLLEPSMFSKWLRREDTGFYTVC